ncbi:hypothetical protein DFH07DRAFT_767737 [Mycena maculata]|uniref:Uncharacterized protein n=1 Tax=Mycena maculata TaxID=230809 RepID=A0AAD7JY75_9AGAR|nr:hypothetical protein DFH07DRAFT_767737 [Mycena maculata]
MLDLEHLIFPSSLSMLYLRHSMCDLIREENLQHLRRFSLTLDETLDDEHLEAFAATFGLLMSIIRVEPPIPVNRRHSILRFQSLQVLELSFHIGGFPNNLAFIVARLPAFTPQMQSITLTLEMHRQEFPWVHYDNDAAPWPLFDSEFMEQRELPNPSLPALELFNTFLPARCGNRNIMDHHRSFTSNQGTSRGARLAAPGPKIFPKTAYGLHDQRSRRAEKNAYVRRAAGIGLGKYSEAGLGKLRFGQSASNGAVSLVRKPVWGTRGRSSLLALCTSDESRIKPGGECRMEKQPKLLRRSSNLFSSTYDNHSMLASSNAGISPAQGFLVDSVLARGTLECFTTIMVQQQRKDVGWITDRLSDGKRSKRMP